MKKVIDYLQKLGLSELEAKLYSGLLETGTTTVMELANHVGIKRITAHFNVERLIEMGLVSETRKGARRQIVAEDPDKIKTLIERRENDLDSLKKDLPGILTFVTQMSPAHKDQDRVEVRYYEGKKAVDMVYQETLKFDEVYSFADLDKYYEVFPDRQDMFVEALEKNSKRKVWDLLVDSQLSREIGLHGGFDRYFVKLLPNSAFFEGFGFADYIIYGNKVAIVQLDSQNPSATVLESEQISLSLRALHRSMWVLLPDIAKVS